MDNEFEEKIQSISNESSKMFDILSDYIWKSPRLIEVETKIEIEKLDIYFPPSEDADESAFTMMLRQMRWKSEENKLKNVFPNVMAISNLYLILSYFEFCCFRLCLEIESRGGTRLSEVHGYGVNKLLQFLKISGISTEEISFRKQVIASLKIRNCLMHANGIISWTKKDNAELKRIVNTGEYWRHMDGIKGADTMGLVVIIPGSYGEQLNIKNDYAFVVSGYTQRFFVQVCSLAKMINTNGYRD
ncbi:hypothetical protein [Acetobacter indonesiensis]|uniref:hypothetical protein n=1 Tax=Acetobacter indonesiensis TaxID=104101 RepID=UPI0039ED6653